MSSVERLVVVVVLAALALCACNVAHNSTETGNPPVIDLKKISLVVSADGVRIVGQPGAVTPGGADIELEVAGSSEVIRGKSEPDGSFDIALDADPDAVVEVSATDGDKRSSSVRVTRGGASVVGGDAGTLSCMERSQLASQMLASAVKPDASTCQRAADCVQVSNRTVCTDSCSDLLVSTSEVAAVKDAVNSINEGLCASFAADGCNVIAQPCVPTIGGLVACIAGKCGMEYPPEVMCPSCLNHTVEWGPSSRQRSYSAFGCESFRTTMQGAADCTGEIAHCDSGSENHATVEDLIQALQQPDVKDAMNDMGTFGGPPAPGGMSTLINVDGRPFFVSNCSGPNCTEIPVGISALAQLLDRIATNTVCDQPSCPPNGGFFEDVCLSCGPGGGCAEKTSGCRVLCADSSSCDAGMSCSSRGICELVCF
jgi:hypothetical protein